MPYVDKELRKYLEDYLDYTAQAIRTLAGGWSDPDVDIAHKVGLLNYCMTSLALRVLEQSGPENYARLSAIHGTFLAAAAEFYRRKVAPYEDKKRKENGDVY